MTGKAHEKHVEETRGAIPYVKVLQEIHRRLNPSFYLEIGVRHGRTLSLASGPAIGVDPHPDIRFPIGDDAHLFEQTSDDFFQRQRTHRTVPRTQGLAFIDGLHLFEFALRDFINVERFFHPTSLVVIDDIFPNHPVQASRHRQSRVWTGDVWKVHACLREYRPELTLLPLDTSPTGLLVVAGLDPDSRVLEDSYVEILRRFNQSDEWSLPPERVINREGAVSPETRVVGELLDVLADAGGNGAGSAEVRRALSAARQSECGR